MKFLLDENIGKKVADYLQQLGHLTLRVKEIHPSLNDYDVLVLAVAKKAILITSDKDFGELVFKEKQAHCGIILLRLKDETSANKIKALTLLLSTGKEMANKFGVITQKNNGFAFRKALKS